MNWFDNLCHGIKNCKLFFSVVWSFRPWDSYHTLVVLRRCLELTKPEIKGFEGDEKAQRQIQSCIDCIDRLLEDNYCAKEWAEFDKKYGELKHQIGEKDKDGFVPFTLYREGGTEGKLDEQTERKLSRKLYELEAHRMNQDIETLFNTLKKFRNWWS
jgi:hypothetical protein